MLQLARDPTCKSDIAEGFLNRGFVQGDPAIATYK